MNGVGGNTVASQNVVRLMNHVAIPAEIAMGLGPYPVLTTALSAVVGTSAEEVSTLFRGDAADSAVG